MEMSGVILEQIKLWFVQKYKYVSLKCPRRSFSDSKVKTFLGNLDDLISTVQAYTWTRKMRTEKITRLSDFIAYHCSFESSVSVQHGQTHWKQRHGCNSLKVDKKLCFGIEIIEIKLCCLTWTFWQSSILWLTQTLK